MKRLIFCVVLCFCAGQGCPAPTGVANDPSPPPQTRKGILQGVYTGTDSCAMTITAYGDEGPKSSNPPQDPTVITRDFGADGNLLTVQGTPLMAGDGFSTSFGPLSGEWTVSSVTLDDQELIVLYDIFQVLDMGDEQIFLSGSERRSYRQQSDGSVIYESSLNTASQFVEGGYITVQQSCSATLR